MNFHKRSNGKNRDSYGSSVAHKALTKEVVAQRLALPNGPEHMMHYVSEAFPFAYELFSEGNSAACAFLCRCAKQENTQGSLTISWAASARPFETPCFPINPSSARMLRFSWVS